MWVVSLIIFLVFLAVILLIVFNVINRAVAAMAGALVCFFTLTFLAKVPLSLIMGYIVGTAEDSYGNFKTLILVMGIMFIVEISHEGGVFQFIAFKLIQFTKGRPTLLLFVFCLISVLMAGILNNVLTVMVMVPLTISVARILNIDPTPYILSEAVLVNQGATIFSFSSIPNILIVNYTGITFAEFFLNVGVLSLIISVLTICFFLLVFQKKLMPPKGGLEILLEFNVWNFVPNRSLMKSSSLVLILVIIGFIVIPSTLLGSEIISLLGAVVLIIISRTDVKILFKKIDFELLVYLFAIFLISGALEYTGLLESLGNLLLKLTMGDLYKTLLFILWGSAYIGSNIDNIPITKILLPVTDNMTEGFTFAQKRFIYYGLTFGANWGDNLNPMGDNIIVFNVAEQNKTKLQVKDFFILGFVTTNFQLLLLTIYFSYLINWVSGLMLTGITVILIAVVIFAIRKKKGTQKIKS